jgi:hypothetical protein
MFVQVGSNGGPVTSLKLIVPPLGVGRTVAKIRSGS